MQETNQRHFEIRVGDKLIWSAWPKQDEWLNRTEFEILAGGARGPGKTAAGIAWLVTGNHEPTGTVADGGYFRHRSYRALVLRRNIVDMSDWISKAKDIYVPMGATYTARPCEFKFPSGATIVIGHLEDEDAYSKWQGQEFARLLVEELTQIPSCDLYIKTLASVRCPHDEMRPQVFLTANPGGPGHGWVRERFVVPCPPGTPYQDPKTKLTRIFIPGRVADNPIYRDDKQYLGQLMSLSPMIRRAWLDGDWDAIAGQYFDEFRVTPNTALAEPPEARHVWHSTEAELKPWYHRWLSVDWGYTHNAAVYKYCQEPNGRIHVYDELVVAHTTPEELGIAIGQFIWPDMQGSNAQQAWQMLLSWEAFTMADKEASLADYIGNGLSKVIGSEAVYVLPPSEGNEDLLARAEQQRGAHVMIQRASNQRVAGWMNIKALMRWWAAAPPQDDKFDPQFALALQRQSASKYNDYCALFQDKAEVLPRLIIHGDRCPKLIRAIPLARANDPDKGDPEDINKKHFDGMDSLDSLRYGLFAAKAMQLIEPFEEYFAKHIAKYAPGGLEGMDGNSKVWIARKAEAGYAALTGANSKPIHFPISTGRARRSQHRVN